MPITQEELYICSKVGLTFIEIIEKHVDVELLFKRDQHRQDYVACFMGKEVGSGDKEYTKKQLASFGSLLPKLASLYDIPLQEGRDTFFSIKEINGKYLAYEFYMTPDALHRVLMETSGDYLGYRSGQSIETIAHPERSAVQTLAGDTVYLFPVVDEGSMGVAAQEDTPHDMSLLIRNAGCNTSEVLSYQFSVWLQECMPEIYGDAIPYGHYSSPILQDVELYPEDLIMAAYLSLGVDYKDDKVERYINPQCFNGEVPLHLKSSYCGFFKPIQGNDKALFAYAQSSVPPSELSHISSLEVPKIHYLECLMTVLERQRRPGDRTDRTISIVRELKEKIQQQEETRSIPRTP